MNRYLLSSSQFFKAAFCGVLKVEGSGEKHIDLEDTDPDLFQLLTNFCNIGYVLMPGEARPECRQLVDLWFKAEEWSFPGLQDAAILGLEELRALSAEKIFPVEFVGSTYRSTLPGNVLRMYLADSYARFHLGKLENGHRYPIEFLQDVINSTKRYSINHDKFTHKDMSAYFVPLTRSIPTPPAARQ